MTVKKGTIIGTNKNPIVLGKKKRRPNINSQAYRDNYDRIFGKKEEKGKTAILKEKPLPYLLVMKKVRKQGILNLYQIK